MCLNADVNYPTQRNNDDASEMTVDDEMSLDRQDDAVHKWNCWPQVEAQSEDLASGSAVKEYACNARDTDSIP